MWNLTKASKLLDIQYPILLGPFGGGMSTVELTAVVTDQQFDDVKSQFKKYFDEAGGAMPAKPPVFKCRKRNIKLVGAATTLDEAIALDDAGVDMIIASGFEAGGHRPTFMESAEQSTTGTFVLIQLIKEKVKTPIIAAGGIATGRGIVSAMTCNNIKTLCLLIARSQRRCRVHLPEGSQRAQQIDFYE